MADEPWERRVMLLLARDAFDAACRRWNAQEPDDVGAVFAPLTEALWWAVSLDERFHHIDEAYRQRRDADQNGRILPGVHWARNRAGHQQAMVAEWIDGTELGRWPMGRGRFGRLSGLHWRPATEVEKGRSDRGLVEYRRFMEGRPVALTVESVREWFHGGAAAAGPLAQ